VEGSKDGCCKASRRRAGTNRWCLYAPACAQISPKYTTSWTGETGHWLERRFHRGLRRQGSGYSYPNPTLTDPVRWTEQKADQEAGQWKATSPKVSVVESQTPRSKESGWIDSPPQRLSPLEGSADLLENVHTEAYTEFTRRLLSTASFLPTGEARPLSVVKTKILFTAKYGYAASDQRRINGEAM
jgi:hypothetical protein